MPVESGCSTCEINKLRSKWVHTETIWRIAVKKRDDWLSTKKLKQSNSLFTGFQGLSSLNESSVAGSVNTEESASICNSSISRGSNASFRASSEVNISPSNASLRYDRAFRASLQSSGDCICWEFCWGLWDLSCDELTKSAKCKGFYKCHHFFAFLELFQYFGLWQLSHNHVSMFIYPWQNRIHNLWILYQELLS